MADGPEVGVAYISLVPAARGFASAITQQINGPAEDAGSSAGASLSQGLLGNTADTGTKLVRNLGLVAAGGFALNAAKNVEDANNIIVRSTGASGDKLESLQGSFRDLAGSSSATFDVLATTLSDVSKRTGLTGDSLETLTRQIVTFNKITPDAPIGVQELTKALAGFNVPAAEMSSSLDKIFVISQRTGVPLAQLVSDIDSAGPVLRQFGIPVDQAANFLAELNKGGVDASTVVSGLRTAMVKFAKDGKEPAAALREVVGGIQDLIAKGDVAGARDLAVTLFGARGVGLVDALIQGKVSLDALNASVDTTGKGILETSADTATLSGKLGIMRNNLSLIGGQLAAPLLGSFTDSISAALPFVQQFAGVLEGLPTPVQTVLGGLIALGAAAGPLSDLRAAFGGIGSVVPGLIGVLAPLGPALLAALPFIAIAAAAALAVFLIVKNWDKIAAFFVALWEKITDGASTAWSAITGFVTGAAGKVRDVVVGVFTKVNDFVIGIFTGIADFFSRWWKVIVLGIFTGGLSLIVFAVVRNWEKIRDFTISVFTGIVSFLSNLPAWFFGIFTSVFNVVVGVNEAILNFIASIPGRIIGLLSSLITSVPGLFSAAWNFAVSAVVGQAEFMIGFVAELPGRILGALGDLNSLLLDAGRSIITGLISGITDALPALWDTVKSIPSNILGFVQDGIGFGSPAKKFIPLGLSIPEGIGVGIRTGAFIPRREIDNALRATVGSTAVPAIHARAFPAALGDGQGGVVVNGPLVNIENATIRDDSDITKLSRQLSRDVNRGLRSRGKNVALLP